MARVFTITQGLENMGALKTGGQGSVYKARRIGEILTAVKLLPTPIYSESPDDKHFMDFQNEVEKLKKVNLQPNPHVVKILNSGLTESGNLPFIEMEFIEGPDMEELLKPPHEKIFTIKEAIKVADQLSFALSHCHNVNVKHGDIKSNNVKFNVHTGNYVLLDFGLAIMSEEQRRTSMRQVGAIEFMAPEQNEGLMFFETDVYSFGVILYELLAGFVPFPLQDRSETARNRVMLAHMEVPVPDMMESRRSNLPAVWGDEKREREMQVPKWLITAIKKCLEKRPADRFKNGMELHQFIVHHSTLAENQPADSVNIGILQAENERLRTLVLQYQEAASMRDSQSINSHKVLSVNEALSQRLNEEPMYADAAEPASGRRRPLIGALMFFLLLAGAAGVVYKYRHKINIPSFKPVQGSTQTPARTEQPTEQLDTTTYYKVVAPRAYFHTWPSETSKRSSYMTASEELLKPIKQTEDYIYIEYINANNKMSKGWINKRDLIGIIGNSRNNSTSTGEDTNSNNGVDNTRLASQ